MNSGTTMSEYPKIYFNEYFKRKPGRLFERQDESLFTMEEYGENHFAYMSVEDHEKEITALKDREKKLVEVVSFYANKQKVNEMINGTGDDFEDIDGRFCGGKRARKALKDLEVE